MPHPDRVQSDISPLHPRALQIFNQFLMQPSHGTAFQSAHAHLRVLDIDLWVNSKIFFRSRRAKYIPGAASQAPLPVMVHMNYVSALSSMLIPHI